MASDRFLCTDELKSEDKSLCQAPREGGAAIAWHRGSFESKGPMNIKV